MSLHRCSFKFPTISSNNMVKPRRCNVGKMLNFTMYVNSTFTGLRRSCCCYRIFFTLIQSVHSNSGIYEFRVIHTANPKGSQDRSVRRTSYASAEGDIFGSYVGTDVCVYNPENINNCERVTEEARFSMVLLLQQYGLVLVNMCNLEF
jgi:hypothetical protein